MMAEGAGFEVHDIGVDQSLEKFMAAADKVQTDDHRHERTADDDNDLHENRHRRFSGGRSRRYQDGDWRRADQPDVRRRNRRRRLRAKRIVRGRPVSSPRCRRRRARRRDCRAKAPSTKDTVKGGTVATFKILRWQEIPSQVKAEDDVGNEVTLDLASKFAEHIDAVAQKRGFTSGDQYLEQWKWSEEEQRKGSAQEVAEAVKAELEAAANW